MKSLFVGALAVAFASAALPTIAHPSQSDTISRNLPSTLSFRTIYEAAIAVIINSVATFADQGEFASIAVLYAEEIQMDYTSLWGGDVQTYTPERLMAAWAGVLPGFDQTYHDISNIQVDVVGDRAIATADVIADHYLEEGHWQVTGQYEYCFVKQANQWQITHMTLNLTGEVGDRNLVNLASEKAAINPNPLEQ